MDDSLDAGSASSMAQPPQFQVSRATSLTPRWLGRLQLRFATDGFIKNGLAPQQSVPEHSQSRKRSYLACREHFGPLLVQKTLHPEGSEVCHAIVIHPPGGVAGGDSLALTVKLDEHASALLTTPGAGKWYKANQLRAEQSIRFTLDEGASLEWFPQENILFDGADVLFDAEVHLNKNAVYATWDIVCLGRQARSEVWQQGRYRQRQTLYRDNKPIWVERATLTPQDAIMQSMTGLGEHPVFGTMLLVKPNPPSELIEQSRTIMPDRMRDPKARIGVTVLPELIVVRYVGSSSQSAKQYFEQQWMLLRPWLLNRPAVKPRIWNT